MSSAIGYTNRVLTATLTANDLGVDGLGPSNLANPYGSPATGWQTFDSATPSSQFTITTTSALSTWGCLSLHRTNLTSDATIRVRVGLGGLSTTYYDSGVTSGLVRAGYQQAVMLFPQVAGTVLVVDISDTGNPDRHINIPLCYAGPIWTPGRTIDHASAISHNSEDAVVVSRSGVEYVTPRYNQRKFDLSYSGLTTAEVWSDLHPLLRTAKTGANILFIPDTAEMAAPARQPVFGRLSTSSDVTYDKSGEPIRAWRGAITERI